MTDPRIKAMEETLRQIQRMTLRAQIDICDAMDRVIQRAASGYKLSYDTAPTAALNQIYELCEKTLGEE